MAPDPAQSDIPDIEARRRAERRDGWRAGLRAAMPALVATGTWGLVTGVAMVKSGLTESMALAMTLLVYAGSAQLTSLPLIATGAPLWLVFAAGLVVNVRFIIFGAALHPFFRHLSWKRRFLLGYFTTDMAFVLFMPRFGDAAARGTREQLWFFLGAIVPGWFVWQSSSIAGVLLASFVPTAWSLDFAAVLALLAITVPLASSRPMIVAMLAAGVVAWVGQPLPLRLGLAAAVAAGIVAGMSAERYWSRP
ncbi:AzlC family ABC transporter permease [Orrella sp. JC864]|uniref:AzlC family ABC transporter permease n=1 Tax=Orrella sp. JC864 TaxID=3120298 RepID=UPI00300B993B